MNCIPFNVPYSDQKAIHHLQRCLRSGKVGGNGPYTRKCHSYFEKKFGFIKCFLTTSCTDALEMISLLTGINHGDEVIIPSYTFVSSANPFLLRGASIVFADSQKDNPNIAADEIEKLITSKTKAIVPVHYGGIACNMDPIMALGEKYNLFIIEDAAQGICSYYKSKPVGSMGHFGAMSFHATKNITCGEGGLLIINDKKYIHRSEIIWEKGTNRAAFLRGDVHHYGWVEVGSSYLPSDLTAAFLWSQLQSIKLIQEKRIILWYEYYHGLKELEDGQLLKLPVVPGFATVNGQLFYIVCNNKKERNRLILHLQKKKVQSAFHYLALHKSSFFMKRYDGRPLPNADMFTDCLLRLPLHNYLSINDIRYVIKNIKDFYLR